jgi:hypothetical protein
MRTLTVTAVLLLALVAAAAAQPATLDPCGLVT